MRRNAKPATRVEAEPKPSPVPGVERNVFILGIVSFFTDISSEAVYPLVPMFLTTTLNAPLAAVGVIEGVAESTASALRWPAGWLSDRLGRRKPFVVLGYGMAAVAKPLLALAYHWPTVLFARAVDRFGKGLRTALATRWWPSGRSEGSAAAPSGSTAGWIRRAPCWGRWARWPCWRSWARTSA